MIPHHQNEVNMAKTLLKAGILNWGDLMEDTSDCQMEVILREIINEQNHQIQVMPVILEANKYSVEDHCKVEIKQSTSSASLRLINYDMLVIGFITISELM